MILFDTWKKKIRGRETEGIHLVSDESLAELHQFAGALGLDPSYFQDKDVPHYDAWGSRQLRRVVALSRVYPVEQVESKELVRRAVRS